METQPATHNTFVIERIYKAAPERVFSAFADSTKKRRWFAEGHNHEVVRFEMDFVVGGIEVAEYRLNENTPFPGGRLMHEGCFLDIRTNARIVAASTMTFGDRRISASLATIELVESQGGTKLIFTHQAAFFEGADGPKMREAGWTSLFDQLSIELSEL